MTTHSNVSIEQMVHIIVNNDMHRIKTMKKSELQLLVKSLMLDVIRELDEFTIRDLYNDIGEAN